MPPRVGREPPPLVRSHYPESGLSWNSFVHSVVLVIDSRAQLDDFRYKLLSHKLFRVKNNVRGLVQIPSFLVKLPESHYGVSSGQERSGLHPAQSSSNCLG